MSLQTRRTPGEKAFDLFNVVGLGIVGFFTLYPFVNTLAVSLSDSMMVASGRVNLIPVGWNLDGYRVVLSSPVFYTAFVNTVLVTAVGTTINILMTCLGAYPLSRKDLAIRVPFMMMIVITMFIAGGMIPTYLVVRSFGLLNKRLALIIPLAINSWNLILLRNFFQEVPMSLEESAKIDGANEFTILFRIMIPLSLPAIATLSLFYAVGHWNNFRTALMYITDPRKQVLQVFLSQFVVARESMGTATSTIPDEEIERMNLIPDTLRAAVVVCTVAPILVVYPWVQRYFVKGVIVGSLKG